MSINFRELFPLVDFQEQYTFKNCFTLKDFLKEIVLIYFKDNDLRTRQACLSVYMAMRDHYPSYLEVIDQEQQERLNFDIQKSDPKIIKLRRIVLSQLSKVA